MKIGPDTYIVPDGHDKEAKDRGKKMADDLWKQVQGSIDPNSIRPLHKQDETMTPQELYDEIAKTRLLCVLRSVVDESLREDLRGFPHMIPIDARRVESRANTSIERIHMEVLCAGLREQGWVADYVWEGALLRYEVEVEPQAST